MNMYRSADKFPLESQYWLLLLIGRVDIIICQKAAKIFSTKTVHVNDVVTDCIVMHSPNFLFLSFLVLSLANPSNVSHCKCFFIIIDNNHTIRPSQLNNMFHGLSLAIYRPARPVKNIYI